MRAFRPPTRRRNDIQTKIVKIVGPGTHLYYGPTPPKGKEKNWVQTIPGQGWWVYLRFYAPSKAYFDKSWSIGGDFEKID